MKKALMLTAVLALAWLGMPGDAAATPEFAKQWESSCASCHVGAPTELDEEGVAFKLAGFDQAVEAKNPRPKLFFSMVTDLVTFSSTPADDDMETPESATLFSLVRLDREGRFKVFAIGELADQPEGLELDFAHGHLQVNPLEQRHKLNLRLGNVEPLTRLYNSDMRRLFESPLWSGVEASSGEYTAGGGGHHAHGGGGGSLPGVLPASDWGGDVSSVLSRSLLVAGGYAGDNAYAGVFWKRGGRGFDNSTVAPGFEYGDLTPEEQQVFNRQQTNMAKKWERSVILGLSAYRGSGSTDVFDGAFLGTPAGHDDHMDMGDGHGDEHGDEGGDHDDEGGDHDDEGGGHDDEGDGHGDEGDDHGDPHAEGGDDHADFLPARFRRSSRVVGEVKTRWDRYGVYLVGVYGENDYAVGDGEEWAEHGEFVQTGRPSTDFFAWALEGSARFSINRKLTGRAALRWEELRPEADAAESFQRAVANLTVPVRIMRPALWPYAEVARNVTAAQWESRIGLRLGY